MNKSVRRTLLLFLAAGLVGLGWAMTTGKLTSGWAWPLWLAGFVAIALLAG